MICLAQSRDCDEPCRTGICTYDPGFGSTASCTSEITHIDGTAGVLLYRGYSIYKLAELGDFADSCYLLLHGDLPDAAQKEAFKTQMCRHTLVNEQLVTFFKVIITTMLWVLYFPLYRS